MEDILSIILQGTRPVIHKVSDDYFNNLDITRAYKLARIFVKFADSRLFILLKKYPVMTPNIMWYAINYKNDNILSEICNRESIDLYKDADFSCSILQGNFPKTCMFYIKNKALYAGLYVLENFMLSKQNTKLLMNHVDNFADSSHKCILKNMFMYGFVENKYVEYFNDACFPILFRCTEQQLSNKTLLKLINRYPENRNLCNIIITRNNIRLLELLFRMHKNINFWEEHTILRNGGIITIKTLSSSSLYVFDYCITKKFNSYDLASDAIRHNNYLAFAGLLMLKKLKSVEKTQLFLEVIKIDHQMYSVMKKSLNIIKILLKEKDIDLTNINFDGINFNVIIKIFKDPRINTPQNRKKLEPETLLILEREEKHRHKK
jgi:hypothetical protein